MPGAGINPTVVSEGLRRSNVGIKLGTYSHVLPDTHEVALL
jgi:hypothetical protein